MSQTQGGVMGGEVLRALVTRREVSPGRALEGFLEEVALALGTFSTCYLRLLFPCLEVLQL